MTEITKNIDEIVTDKVNDILSDRDEAEARAAAEEALREAKGVFEQMKASLVAKDAKIVELQNALNEAAEVDTQLGSDKETAERLAKAEEELADWKHRAEVAEAAIATLALEESASTRMQELENDGLALEEEAAEAQYVKIREMTEEEFASYKSELMALKQKYENHAAAKEEELEVAELSEQEVSLIAQSLGCDPADSKCVSLVREVAETMSKVKGNKKVRASEDNDHSNNSTQNNVVNTAPHKEVASQQKPRELSLGEAISAAMDQQIVVSPGALNETKQLWEGYLSSKKQK